MHDDPPHSGSPPRPPAALLSAALLPAALLYGLAIRVRNAWYDRPGRTHRAVVPVISVGNITTGGTGKTPFVIALVERLRAGGHRPAILTRGYGRTTAAEADEVLEFRAAVPGVPVIVDADRVAGARQATTEHDADVLVLDDGFQHRRLARDLDIVLIDALSPFGSGRLLPAGRLREPLSALHRADLLVLTRANQQNPAVLESQIIPRLRRYSAAPLIASDAVPGDLVDSAGQPIRAEAARETKLLGVCGIGNPATFGRSLDALASRRVELLPFPDHHRYNASDVDRIRAAATRAGATAVITARKDWVKLRDLWPAAAPPLWRLDVRTTLRDPEGALDAHLARILTPGRRNR